jgi:hypothetical protein
LAGIELKLRHWVRDLDAFNERLREVLDRVAAVESANGGAFDSGLSPVRLIA